ncbi:MAG TPA: POTRA domain-containing protein [Polyangiaceae bacterium]|nr:POTRA domain-containing protein [Polyangiaceae bacterium]
MIDRRVLWAGVLALVALCRPAQAQNAPAFSEESSVEIPELTPAVGIAALTGKIIGAVEVVLIGQRWTTPVLLKTVHAGDRLTPSLARRGARELTDSGRYARVSVTADLSGDRVILRYQALPRRLVSSVSVEGGKLDEDALLSEARIGVGSEITSASLAQMVERAKAFYVLRGYRAATVEVDVRETDDPMRVALVVRIVAGAVSKVSSRSFVRDGPKYEPDVALDEELDELESSYAVDKGDPLDEESLAAADRALADRLRAAHYHRARVQHQLAARGASTFLYVRVDPGPKFLTRYEGLHSFDGADIDRFLDLEKELDKSVRHLASKVTEFYVRRGFLDVEVEGQERGQDGDRVRLLFFRVREGSQVRVVAREFPCLGGGPLPAAEARRDIDSFLEEELPGGGLLSAVDPNVVDATLGPTAAMGTRAVPLELSPRTTFVADIYERALKHLQDYYRSQGYLSATVGPLELVRRQCNRHSPPGQCIPMPLAVEPKSACLLDAEGIPIEEPRPDARLSCVPDAKKGISCEPRLRIRAPVKLGPQTAVYDLAFEGNKLLSERELSDKAELDLGLPLAQTEIEAARRRVEGAFKEEGFAFAEVRALLDFSGDRTRARVRFVISEGERVYVDGVVVRGAKRTNPALIMRRVSFERCPRDRPLADCEPYRSSAVRKSEERIATLGTFSSVSISLEDPQVPAKRKVVIIEVQERVPQYLDLRPGFSTGEGLRATLEYGHRNLAGQGIQLTLRAQLGYLPDVFILDDQVKANFEGLTVSERLERRNTISIAFPEVLLGPLVRLGIDGIDVRDNARDFGLSKEAGVATFTYRPARSFYAQLGGSLERNDVKIFRGGTVDAYLREVATQGGSTLDLSRLLRVPDGLTFAIAQRIAATWDRRDNAFGATRGTLLIGAVEHVHAYPAEDNPNTRTSDFMRLTGTASGYVRLTPQGLALAVSLRGGRIYQLMNDSKTYPDRLFFLGGVDSLRGFLQDSLVPEDIAEEILRPKVTQLRIENVAIRGGDVYVNPRLELRVPVSGIWEAGLFFDSGNVWVDPRNFDPLKLRYAAGAGIRVATPIGPIAFDYGFNLIRRPWEDRGNFHFSIGLF